MKYRAVTVLLVAGLLGGCSSAFFDKAFKYPSIEANAQPTATEAAPEPTAPAAAKAAPFVSVPEAHALGSTETHQSLRAGTAPPPSIAQTSSRVAPVTPTMTPPPAPVAVAPVAQTAAPSVQPSDPQPTPPQPSAAPTAMASAASDTADSWCVRVAKSAQAEAADQGFDAATQQRRALASFKQCSATAR